MKKKKVWKFLCSLERPQKKVIKRSKQAGSEVREIHFTRIEALKKKKKKKKKKKISNLILCHGPEGFNTMEQKK